MQQAVHAVVSGRVQGVMFRHFTQKNATTLGLVGEVQNMPDGTVQVIAEGKESAIQQLISKLETGPLFARVDAVQATPAEPKGSFKSFSIVYD